MSKGGPRSEDGSSIAICEKELRQVSLILKLPFEILLKLS